MTSVQSNIGSTIGSPIGSTAGAQLPVARVSVCVCVITYLRPEGLERLLRSVGRLELDDVPAGLSVVVIDNDEAGSARAVVERWAATAPWPVHYDIEPARGIPMARNRALRTALTAAAEPPDFVVWMDDDEEADPQWLRHALATQAETGADVVMGPGIPAFEAGVPDWVRTSGLLEGERFVTGRPYPYFHSRTSGILVRTSVLPAEGFDERMALCGGSDRVFFTRIQRAGGRFVWDDRARMVDHVPASRARLPWLLRRWYRTGVTRSLTLLYLDAPGPLRRARRVAGGMALAGRGAVLAVAAIPKGRVAMLRRVRIVMLGIGAAVGALGVQYHEYRVVHGR